MRRSCCRIFNLENNLTAYGAMTSVTPRWTLEKMMLTFTHSPGVVAAGEEDEGEEEEGEMGGEMGE